MTTLSVAPAGWTTYQLTVDLPGGYDNVYALAGTPSHTIGISGPLAIPAAFQSAAPFSADIGGIDPTFFAFSAESEYDSWITVGVTDGSASSALAASPGLALDTLWTDAASFETTDGAIFWMNPNDGPSGSGIVMAQLTIADLDGTQTMTGIVQGKSAVGEDYQSVVAWTMG